MAYTCNNSVQGQTYVIGNWTPSVSNNWRVVICGAYAVAARSDGGVDFYYRFYVQTYGTINTTLQEAYCGGGNFGKNMAGTYLQGASGEDWYYGTDCKSEQYDYMVTIPRDAGWNINETNYVGWVSGSGTVRKTSVTMYYECPKSVKYDANGGSGAPGTQTKYYNKTLTLSSTKPTRAGYTFKGWATSKTATTANYQPGGSYTANAATTLYAVWQINTWKVSYNNNGGTGTIANQTKTYGKSLTLSNGSGFSKTGYTLKSWNTNSAGTGTTYNLGASYTGNAALSLYAKWQINTWAVTYNKNTTDTVSNMPNNQTKTYNQTLTLSSNTPTRTGYTFQGWATSSSSTTVAYKAGASYTGNAALNLYAVWKVNTYTLSVDGLLDNESATNINGYGTFDIYLNGSLASGNSPDFYQKVDYGTKYEIKNIKATAGHTYKGVHYGSLSGTVGTSGATIILAFTTDTYTIYYNKNTTDAVENMPSNQIKTYNQTLTLSSNIPERIGYDFLGWATSASSTTVAYRPGASYTGNTWLALYAVWQVKTYTIHFEKNANFDAVTNIPTDIIKTYGEAAIIPSQVPQRKNYKFIEWVDNGANPNFYKPGDPYIYNRNATLYAIWELAMSTVTIYDENNTKKTGMCFFYDEYGNKHYAIISVYDSNGQRHAVK
jgi:uncharacterized repeat protein (TIGR02543 family)